MTKSEAIQFIIDHFKQDLPREIRRKLDRESLELINWLLVFQNRYPAVRAAFGQDLHQCVRSKLYPYVGDGAL